MRCSTYNISMLSMGEAINRVIEERQKYSKLVTHWKQDIVNLIIDFGGTNPKFDRLSMKDRYQKTYVQILSMLKRSGYSWGDMMSLLKTAEGLPEKYSKTGFIINKLKEASKLNKNYVQTNRTKSNRDGIKRRNGKRTSDPSSLSEESESCTPSLFQ